MSGWRCARWARRRRAPSRPTRRPCATTSSGPTSSSRVFKGQPVTFRDWDGQLRQPILLAADNVVVSVSPQHEFVHQFSPLDTLGIDRPETDCAR